MAVSYSYRWRVVDIAVASVVAVASAFIFWVAAMLYPAVSAVLEPLIPGLTGSINGLWLFAGPLAAIIVRKPGAALYAELVAAALEAFAGNSWGGIETIGIALVQGAGAELAFALFAWKSYNLAVTTLAGTLAGVGCWAYSFVKDLQAYSLTSVYGISYVVSTLISGAVFAGVITWFLFVAIAHTGALDQFASGRMVRGK